MTIRPSVCPFVKRVNCEKRKKHAKKVLSSSLLAGRMVGGRQPLLPTILDQVNPIASEKAVFDLYPLAAPTP